MFKSQMTFQKILFLLILIFGGLIFFYAVGLMTDLYGLYQSRALFNVSGSEVFYDMQAYNKLLVGDAIIIILASCLPFVFATNTRRKYYLDNFISLGVQIVIFVGSALFILINSLKYKAQFLAVDFESYKKYAEMMKFNYSESTFFFDAGVVISILLIVISLLIVFNICWKVKIVKEENRLLGEGK